MLIFLYGEDDFRSFRKLREIKNKFLASDRVGSGLSEIDYRETARRQNLPDVLSSANLLASKRLAIAKNVLSSGKAEEQKEILEFLKSRLENLQKDSDVVAVFWEAGVPDKRAGLFKFLEKNCRKQNFEKLSGIKLEQRILKRIKEIDPRGQIEKKALQKLAVYGGGNGYVLENELQKLASFADGKIISEKNVDNLVRADLDGNIFETIDALVADKRRAVRLVHDHLKKGDDPFYLFSMFVYQFRNLAKVADLKEQGMGNAEEISRRARIHPYVARKSLAQTGKFSLGRIRKIYQELSDLDFRIKTGKIGILLALDKFLVEV